MTGSHPPTPPSPAPPALLEPVNRAVLPHALTFFLTVAQRSAVLKALRRHHRSREAALLRASDIDPDRPLSMSR